MSRSRSGGKPAFLTPRLFDLLDRVTLKAYPTEIATQLSLAQGQEGGLAPALCAGEIISMQSSQEAQLRAFTFAASR